MGLETEVLNRAEADINTEVIIELGQLKRETADTESSWKGLSVSFNAIFQNRQLFSQKKVIKYNDSQRMFGIIPKLKVIKPLMVNLVYHSI